MPQALPTEILERIVDCLGLKRGDVSHVAALLNLCLTSKCLRPRGESHVYSSVTLRFGAHPSYETLYRSTRQFIQTTDQRPHLLHVKQLAVKFITFVPDDAAVLDALAFTIGRMANVTKFSLGYDPLPAGQVPTTVVRLELRPSSLFMQAVSSILGAPHLDYLVLHNLTQLPLELLLLARSIHHLELPAVMFRTMDPSYAPFISPMKFVLTYSLFITHKNKTPISFTLFLCRFRLLALLHHKLPVANNPERFACPDRRPGIFRG